MFKRLKNKWGVNWLQFTLIFTTFAIGGSLSGYLAKFFLGYVFDIKWTFLYIICYLILVTLLWPICVTTVSIFLGQFSFFKKYLSKMGRRMIGRQTTDDRRQMADRKINIAVFASGAGSNARKIIEYTKANNAHYEVKLIVTNKKDAGVIKIAAEFGIPVLHITKERFFTDAYVAELQNEAIEFIVLAGFLWKVPETLINNFSSKIINIHPALLPAYGGKGMYGNNVHKAVLENKEQHSGITIHFVNAVYDNGEIILQEKCEVLDGDSPETLAQRIHSLEHTHFAKTIDNLSAKMIVK